MRFLKSMAFAGMTVLGACNQSGGGKSATAPATLTTEEQKTIYALGLFEGQRVKVFAMSPEELAIMTKGMTDAATGAKPQVDLTAYQPKLQELYSARQKITAEKEKAKGKEVLENAAKEPGAQKLPSGMIIVNIKPGTGASPAATDTVKVNYEGTLPDGTVFDSSYKRGQPAEFPLNGVIKCWTEGVQKMKVGGTSKLTCPADIAYGERGSPPNIPGGATLIFKIELLDIKAQAPVAVPPMMPMTPTPGATPPPAGAVTPPPHSAK